MLRNLLAPQRGPAQDCCSADWKYAWSREAHINQAFTCWFCHTPWAWDAWARTWKKKADG